MAELFPALQLVARPPIHVPTFDKHVPNRLKEIFLYLSDNYGCDQEQQLEQVDNCTKADGAAPVASWRFRLSVVDRAIDAKTVRPTAVFLIPAGRESEFMFGSRTGLLAIAASAQSARLIAVTLSRHNRFESAQQVQAELAYVVQILGRQGLFVPQQYRRLLQLERQEHSIPFMALDGIGQRDVVAEGESKVSGKYVVEQVHVDQDWVRRLYFLTNPFVIQSEVFLVQNDEPDQDGIDERSHHLVVDRSRVAFDYHQTMIAGALGLSAASIQADATSGSSGSCDCLLIGLGGGGLINHLQYLMPGLTCAAIELDADVVMLAKNYFGLKINTNSGSVEDRGLDVRIGNGLQLDVVGCEDAEDPCRQVGDPHTADLRLAFEPESLNFIMIDVDSKNLAVGMSCPPQEFVDVEYLQRLSNLLSPAGALVVNVSARDSKMMKMVCDNLQTVFTTVLVSKDSDGDVNNECDGGGAVNVVVFAVQQSSERLLEQARQNLFDLESGNLSSSVFEELWARIKDLKRWDTELIGSKNKFIKQRQKRKSKRGKRK